MGYRHELDHVSRNELNALKEATRELYPHMVEDGSLKFVARGPFGSYHLIFSSRGPNGEYPATMLQQIIDKTGIETHSSHMFVF
ncbi:hypothetical protein D6745_03070 [Candidatus Woesearchaeota archaeon]|nr:MAG: hypothetical protein D6745_03070 [Candidatus Woesearchaeota archaeon]